MGMIWFDLLREGIKGGGGMIGILPFINTLLLFASHTFVGVDSLQTPSLAQNHSWKCIVS